MFTRDFSMGKALLEAYNKTNGGQYRKGDFMEYKDFAEEMRHIVEEYGKNALLDGKVKDYLSSYAEKFRVEANIFRNLLAAGCVKVINEACCPPAVDSLGVCSANFMTILEIKRQLAERMEEKHSLSPKKTMPLLDLLGFLLKDDMTKCQEQEGDELYDKGEAAWDREDYTEAVSWYQKAAEQGHANAQLNLGACYQGSTGVSSDLKKAEEWYLKAAEQGNSFAMYTLGLYYSLLGSYAKSDKYKAKSDEWYRKAAEHGNKEAQKHLAEIAKNTPAPQDAGSADALFKKGEDAFKRGDYAEALECYLKAAEQGHAEAQYHVGICYKNGFGVSKDKAIAREQHRERNREAFQWYLKAAEQGHEFSQIVVGDYYKSGSNIAGVPQDYAKAAEWYGKAAEQGSVLAQKYLKELKSEGKI